jgi:large subunit ribosomal protein L21e
MPGKRIGGYRRKTRQKMTKGHRQKGKISLSSFFQSFNIGDNVAFLAEPAYQKGMYHPRYHGKVGVVKAKRGDCYEVGIKDGSVSKTMIVHPVHLKRLS